MPLVISTLKAAIIAAQTAASNADSESSAQDIFATQLSAAIDTYIKSGDVTTIVATTGSAVAQTGTGTGKMT